MKRGVAVGITVIILVLVLLVGVWYFLYGAGKQRAAGGYGEAVPAGNAPSGHAAPQLAARSPTRAARAVSSQAEGMRPNPNAYVTSTYLGGRGAKERLAKLIEEGVLVDGKQVKLEAFSHEYSQAFPIPTKTALSLSAETERAKVLTKGGRTYLQVGLQGSKREAPERPPLNLCLVVDRSGSAPERGERRGGQGD